MLYICVCVCVCVCEGTNAFNLEFFAHALDLEDSVLCFAMSSCKASELLFECIMCTCMWIVSLMNMATYVCMDDC